MEFLSLFPSAKKTEFESRNLNGIVEKASHCDYFRAF